METPPIGIPSSVPARQAAPAGPPQVATEAGPASAPGDRVDITDPLQTSWGFGERENLYNAQIADAIEKKWVGPPALPAIILKAQVAQESGFDPKAVSKSGYVGLLQLGTEEATNQGLKLKPVDERTIPEKNLPAGVAVLGIKHGVIHNPTGLWDTPFAHKVQDYYDKNGLPSDRQHWYLSLAAYNGGGGTVLKAMAEAIDRHVDPREWSNLTGPADDPKSSPLYKAVSENYPQSVWSSKFREIAEYPVKILKRAGAE